MVLKVWAQLEASGYTQQENKKTSRGHVYTSYHTSSINNTVINFQRKYLTEKEREMEGCQTMMLTQLCKAATNKLYSETTTITIP